MKFSAVRDPRWANAERSLIDCRVVFGHLQDEVPFTASAGDVEEHGRELFARVSAGEFGPIADYVAPIPTLNQLRARALQSLRVKDEVDRLMAMLDDPSAPQAVKDYAAAIAVEPAP